MTAAPVHSPSVATLPRDLAPHVERARCLEALRAHADRRGVATVSLKALAAALERGIGAVRVNVYALAAAELIAVERHPAGGPNAYRLLPAAGVTRSTPPLRRLGSKRRGVR
jgi:hypothetical protein